MIVSNNKKQIKNNVCKTLILNIVNRFIKKHKPSLNKK